MRTPFCKILLEMKGMDVNNKTLIRIVVTAVVLIGFGAVALANMKSNDTGNMTTSHTMSDDQIADDKTTTAADTIVESNQVTYKGFAVVQKTIKVKKGTTVTWTNEDSAKHDVTPETETADFKTSELFGKDESYSVTFNTIGTFAYYCSPHPYMKGTVEVTE